MYVPHTASPTTATGGSGLSGRKPDTRPDNAEDLEVAKLPHLPEDCPVCTARLHRHEARQHIDACQLIDASDGKDHELPAAPERPEPRPERRQGPEDSVPVG